MALGRSKVQPRFEDPRVLLGDRLRGIYLLLADHGGVMFADDYFADLYKASRLGRPTVPARTLATVMILQAHEGLSDREACDRLERDLAWQAAAGLPTGAESFHPTTLVGLRNRLRASARPRRLFEDTKAAAVEAGVMGRRVRVLDSTPIYDSVATQDTVTQLRSAIRKLLRALHRCWRPRCGPCWPATTTTQDRGNQPVTGTTLRPGRCWLTRWSVTAPLRWPCWTVKRWRVRPPMRSSCWLWSPARTSKRETTGCSASPGGSLPTG
ncbi:transposase [Acidiferrimicrobium sp. IK]|uniref:transposase n=1 Tax=Acidiferrimicrobium sp. IK TaxID=2871700 RepID=UPI0021CB2D78|nr:transposase [Acidiferrimicrobium sp. IK]MCU4185920.1 transposase [Acidiferrimicrobium sp. IK]